MHSVDLEFFMAVNQAASFAGAASKLNTVQSNVTSRIKKLETELGVALFERHSRGVKLTAAGEQLLPFAMEIGQLLREARLKVSASDMPRGPLAIGAMETTTAFRLSGRLAGFTTLHPEIDLTLRTGTTAALVDQVLHQQLEGAFVCGPIAQTRLRSKVAFREELAVVAAADTATLEPFVAQGQANIFVFRHGCAYRQRLEHLLTRRGIAIARTLEYGSIDAMLACVSAGMGITLLPVDLLNSYSDKYRFSIIRLPKDEAQVETLFIHRARAHTSAALAAFLKTFEIDADADQMADTKPRQAEVVSLRVNDRR
jgi:DNA-binding transcriptional LysR family regulator